MLLMNAEIAESTIASKEVSSIATAARKARAARPWPTAAFTRPRAGSTANDPASAASPRACACRVRRTSCRAACCARRSVSTATATAADADADAGVEVPRGAAKSDIKIVR